LIREKMMTNDGITLPSSALNPVFGKISSRPVDDNERDRSDVHDFNANGR